MKTAFLFPGQGAQVAGMGADVVGAFPVAGELFEKANRILGYDLADICFNGPEEKLNSTVISQPAIFVTSAAILDCLGSNPATADIKPDITAGLSLGEYTALYAAGAISFEQGLRLVQKRGQAMQAAADASDGSMVSILGLDAEKVGQLCSQAAEGGLLAPANYNCPGQIVISGDSQSCRKAVELAAEYGAIKAIELKVAGAFHTEMMAPAAEALKEALQSCEITLPGDIQVIANVDAEYYDTPEKVCRNLVRQLIAPVLWQKCMEKLLSAGVDKFYEIGPGRVLTGLMRRISRKTKVTNISNLKAINDLQTRVSCG